MYSQQHTQVLTVNELNKVQDLIESCLQQYMSHNQVVDTLNLQFNVEPTFTKIVWQKLEEQNQDFFKEYNLRLIVKDQVQQFNTLLARQCELMRQTAPADVAPVPRSNGSLVPPLHFDSGSYASFHSGRMVSDDLPNTFFNANVSHNNTTTVQNSNMGMMQGINGPSAGSHMLANVMLGTSSPCLQGASLSSSEQFLRNPSLSDFAAFANNSDKINFEEMFIEEFDQDDFGSDS